MTQEEIEIPIINNKENQENLIPRKKQRKKLKAPKIYRNILQQNVMEALKEDQVEMTQTKLIMSCQTDPKLRKVNDLARIFVFLSNSELARKFRSDNTEEESLENILFNCACEVIYHHLEKEKILFRIGEKGDKFFLIVQGKIEVLKPIPYIEKMTGFKYFSHLMTLNKENEKYILKQTIEANRDILSISKNDFNNLNLILLRLCIEDFFTANELGIRRLEEVFEKCFVNINDFHLKVHNERNFEDEYIVKMQEKIYKQLPQFSSSTLYKFKFLSNNSNQQEFHLFRYGKVIDLSNGQFFGDCALDMDTYRNATIKTSENTHFLYLGLENYVSFLKEEKNRLNAKEVTFLLENYIFKPIPTKYFENKDLSYFKFEEKGKGELIIRENDLVNYFYFIKEGEIEISIYNSVFEVYNLLEYLSKLRVKGTAVIDSENMDAILNLNYIKNDIKELTGELSQRSRNKLIRFREKDSLGLESFFFGMNYLYTAKVLSEKVKYYKLEVKDLLNIINFEGECFRYYEKYAVKRINVLFLRLLNLFTTKLNMIDLHHLSNIPQSIEKTKSEGKLNYNFNENKIDYISPIREQVYITESNIVNTETKQTSFGKFKANSSLQKEKIPPINHKHNHTQNTISTSDNLMNQLTCDSLPKKKRLKLENLNTLESSKGYHTRGTLSLELEKQILYKVHNQAQQDLYFWKTLKDSVESEPNNYVNSNELLITQTKIFKKDNKPMINQNKNNCNFENEKTNLFRISSLNSKLKKNDNSSQNTLCFYLPEVNMEGDEKYKSFRSKKYLGQILQKKKKKYSMIKKAISDKLQNKLN